MLPDSTVDSDNKTTSWDLGTIVHVDEDGTVNVEWDMTSSTSQKAFKKEDNNQYKLLLYDNTQAGMTFCLLNHTAHLAYIKTFALVTDIPNNWLQTGSAFVF